MPKSRRALRDHRHTQEKQQKINNGAENSRILSAENEISSTPCNETLTKPSMGLDGTHYCLNNSTLGFFTSRENPIGESTPKLACCGGAIPGPEIYIPKEALMIGVPALIITAVALIYRTCKDLHAGTTAQTSPENEPALPSPSV